MKKFIGKALFFAAGALAYMIVEKFLHPLGTVKTKKFELLEDEE